MKEYLTAKELAQELGFSPNYINRLRGQFFIEGIHFVRPFGRSIRYIWPEVKREINRRTKPKNDVIPMKRGGYCHG
jgi:hypothetical protein